MLEPRFRRALTHAFLALALALLAGCASNPSERCGPAGECSRASFCYRGFCLSSTEAPDGALIDGGSCLPPQLTCGGACIDPLTDGEHCGSCARCHAGTPLCVAGHCQAM